jgi:cytidine deaminase
MTNDASFFPISHEEIFSYYLIAKKARNNAYAPYSGHPVGAIIISSQGNAFVGANFETAHYQAICAEAAAISAMITSGEKDIVHVIISGPSTQLCTPCGDCRQRIREFSVAGALVHIFDTDDNFRGSFTIEQLLPYSFSDTRA